jgi:hypothetical protein
VKGLCSWGVKGRGGEREVLRGGDAQGSGLDAAPGWKS